MEDPRPRMAPGGKRGGDGDGDRRTEVAECGVQGVNQNLRRLPLATRIRFDSPSLSLPPVA